MLSIKLFYSYTPMNDNIIHSSIPFSIFHGENYGFGLLKWEIFLFSRFKDYFEWYYLQQHYHSKSDLKERFERERAKCFSCLITSYGWRNIFKNYNSYYCKASVGYVARGVSRKWKSMFRQTAILKEILKISQCFDFKDNEITKNYYSRIKEIINQLRAYGKKYLQNKGF